MENQIAQQEKNCQEYLSDNTDQNAEQFSIEEFCEMHDLSPEKAEIFICNLEDFALMCQLADGQYDNFDMMDETLFNDGYKCIMSEMIRD